MKKIALLFVVAVFAPSLVLAWLAVRSVRDQQMVVAQQQNLLFQSAADYVAKEVRDYVNLRQREFSQAVEGLRADRDSVELASRFDELLRQHWPLADVGFAVSLGGDVLSPSLFGRAEARVFRLNNDRFLCSREPVEVFWSTPKGTSGYKTLEKPDGYLVKKSSEQTTASTPSVEAGEAEFKQLVGDSYEGTVARFLQDALKVLVWHRSATEPEIVYGAQLNLTNLIAGMRELIATPSPVRGDAVVALLDEHDRVVAGAAPGGQKPTASAEVGHALPHWRVALFLSDPASPARTARSLALTLGWIIALMVAAIAIGGSLLAADLRRQMRLARQKTDFVSNVSHELKTPLTSIRMFSELLSEGKATDERQRKEFLDIISAEAARLTRLINNVLDFARMERGDSKYQLRPCDLAAIVRDTVASYRPHLEASGFTVDVRLPERSVPVSGDCDALAQVLVNLLSNAEKYGAPGRHDDSPRSAIAKIERSTITVELVVNSVAQLRVLDRGPGVPRGSEERIFEQFYRANDSLSSGVQGSGLGLTLARQIARAHGGDVRYEPRQGGGSCFAVTLPLEG